MAHENNSSIMRTIKSVPKEGNLDRTLMEMSMKLTLLSRQNDILSNELTSLKKSHRELVRKYNSLTLWRLIRGRHR